LWGNHPNLQRIEAFEDLEHKIAAVAGIIRQLTS